MGAEPVRPAEPAKKSKPQITGPGILLLVVAIGLCGVMWWNVTSGGASATQSPTQDRDSAGRVQSYAECKDAVSAQLLAPSEAEFASLILGDATAEKRSDGTFFVRSFVDSPNAFGTKVRTQFTCTVATDGKDTWKVVDVKIQQ